MSFVTEKKDGYGEDAPPLLVTNNMAFVVGVFDGMGGAGAAVCDSAFGSTHTKAYVASRIVRDEIASYFDERLGKRTIVTEELKGILINRFNRELTKYPSKSKSILRSKLVRDYPTTMAIVTLYETENEYEVNSYWAGDSHCYLWTPKGFYQISKDDLEEDNDPMENLRNDAAISNCICADRDFKINHNKVILSKGPVVILSATDGCFGYFPTPMHFEDKLKSCLRKSKNEEDWKNRVIQIIQEVTGDDTSLSLIGVGFESFSQFKNMMAAQSIKVIGKLKDLESNITSQKQKLAKMQSDYEQTIKNGWESYKQKYMRYVNQDSDGNA